MSVSKNYSSLYLNNYCVKDEYIQTALGSGNMLHLGIIYPTALSTDGVSELAGSGFVGSEMAVSELAGAEAAGFELEGGFIEEVVLEDSMLEVIVLLVSDDVSALVSITTDSLLVSVEVTEVSGTVNPFFMYQMAG